MKKSIEEKYQKMSEIEHILHRPSMYTGSTKAEEKDIFIYNNETGKMKQQTISFIPALYKIIDEVISNSVDEYRRSDNMGIDTISIYIDKINNYIEISDNGGIPIVKHKKENKWLPEFIFGTLRTSSNYDDLDDRNVIGTNGVGVKIANIFSTKFIVESADCKNKLSVSWHDNMTPSDDIKIEKCKDHFTKIGMTLDLKRFDITELPADFINIIHKRCIDAAAANPGLKVIFKCNDINENWKFKSFEDYIDLYSDLLVDIENKIVFKNNFGEYYIYPESNIDVAFVNGAECSKGTHIRAIRNPINNTIVDYLQKKDKIEVTTRAVDGKYAVFCNISITNPSYDSQTKECLTTPQEAFSKDEANKFEIPNQVLDKIIKSEIVDLMRDWYKQKQAAEDLKTLRKLNAEAKKGLKRPKKYVQANSKKKSERELWIYEGDSAATGFRVARNPETQGAYLMRGVPLNCLGMTPVQIMKNEVFNDIITILGLQFGEDFDPKKLNYGKIVIATDGDVDGDKIAALLLLFFNNWPELIESHIVCRSMSPIIVASKGKNKEVFYKMEDYRERQKELKTWQIKYTKGLGGLNPAEYKDMMRNPKFLYFHKDKMADVMFNKWFGKESDNRKELMSDIIKNSSQE